MNPTLFRRLGESTFEPTEDESHTGSWPTLHLQRGPSVVSRLPVHVEAEGQHDRWRASTSTAWPFFGLDPR